MFPESVVNALFETLHLAILFHDNACAVYAGLCWHCYRTSPFNRRATSIEQAAIERLLKRLKDNTVLSTLFNL